jgi:hypothetical protein
MNAVTFDTLKFANRLKAAGVLPAHAEAEAEALAEAMDAQRRGVLAEVERQQRETQTAQQADRDKADTQHESALVRIEAKTAGGFAAMEKRFAEMDRRFADVDRRFAEQDAKMDKRFAEQDAKLNEALFALTWRLIGAAGALVAAVYFIARTVR